MTVGMVRIIGSAWHGSRLPAPKFEVPKFGKDLKLRGKNFRLEYDEEGGLVAYYQGELSRDIVGHDEKRRYDVCAACNLDEHTCPGCGCSLSHDGVQLTRGEPDRGFKHGTRCVD